MEVLLFPNKLQFSWYQEWKTNIQTLCCGWKTKYLLTQKHLHQHPRKQLHFKQIQWGASS